MPDGSDILTRLRSQHSRPRASAPPGARIYAIGDIHGHVDLLADLHRRIVDDMVASPAARKVVVYLGDYVDRGPSVRDTIDRILDADLPASDTVCLLGNHEEAMLDFIASPEEAQRWLSYGGIETMASYGVRIDSEVLAGLGVERTAARFAAAMPARHHRFFEALAPTHVEGDYFFVHAGVRPGVPLDRQERDDLLWIRDEFLESGADHGKVVVHGHSIRRAPEIRANRIGVDTGAFATGCLTCVVLEGDGMKFIQTAAWRD